MLHKELIPRKYRYWTIPISDRIDNPSINYNKITIKFKFSKS